MNIIERILKFIDFKQVTKYKFYQITGFSNGFLDKNSNIGSDKCEKIIECFPDLSLEWLITGKGSMLRKEVNEDYQQAPMASEPQNEYKTKSDSDVVNNLLDRLQQQSKEIGRLNAEIESLKRGDFPDAQDVGVAAAG